MLPRLPGPPYHFVTRIVSVDGPPAGRQPGITATAEYDVPAQAWYFEQNGTPTMPLAVLMEVALQPCGWLATYAGSVLNSEADLRFRNLDGTGTVLREVPPGTAVLRSRVELTSLSQLGDVTIVSFTATCTALGGPADGHAVFQVRDGLWLLPRGSAGQPGRPDAVPGGTGHHGRGRRRKPPTCAPARRSSSRTPRACPGRCCSCWTGSPDTGPTPGAAGLGRLRACKDVDPGEWFFRAHFFQDPVMPGSLGVEAMCQLLQWYLIERGATAGLASPRFEPIMTGQPLTWKYRGQVRPADGQLTVELEITAIGQDDHGRYAVADGWLWVDGVRIYHVAGLGMRVVPGDQP